MFFYFFSFSTRLLLELSFFCSLDSRVLENYFSWPFFCFSFSNMVPMYLSTGKYDLVYSLSKNKVRRQ